MGTVNIPTPPPVFQEGLRPAAATFKVLLERGHAEFTTMRLRYTVCAGVSYCVDVHNAFSVPPA